MALVETAGAAWIQTTTTNVQTSATFTPAANALIVCLVAVGNGNGIVETSRTITDTFGGTASGSWTILVERLSAEDEAGTGVYVKDAGASPTSGAITVTASPSTVLDPGLIARNFTGAAPAASQTGDTASAFGNPKDVTITPTATGSQVVGAFAINSGTARTANANTTIYGQSQGDSGNQVGAMKMTALTTVAVNQVMGYTVAQNQTSITGAEILQASADASVNEGDTGTGAEGSPSISATLSDTGSGVETQSINTSFTGTDTGSGAGGIPDSAQALPDTGSGAESESISVAFTSTDSGSGAEGTPDNTQTLSDTGSGADAASISVSFTAADTGSGAETGSVSASFTSTDTGSGAETESVTVLIPGADTGTGTEGTPGTARALTDTGSGAESVSISASFTGTDSGSGSAGTPDNSQSLADTGSGVETESVTVLISSADSGSGVGSESISSSLTGADNGSGVETESVVVLVSGTDTGSGVDTGSISASFTGTDVGTAGDTTGIAAILSSTDSSSGVEGTPGAAFARADTGAGVEGAPDILETFGPSASDSGVGAEGISTASALSGTDTSSGSDADAIYISFLENDFATGASGESLLTETPLGDRSIFGFDTASGVSAKKSIFTTESFIMVSVQTESSSLIPESANSLSVQSDTTPLIPEVAIT